MPRAAAAQGDPLGSEFRVNTFTTGSQADASVAMAALGEFVVVWTSATQDGSGFGIFGQRFASSGAPLGLEFRVNTYTTGNQYAPSVSMAALGEFVVVWHGGSYQDGSALGVFGQRFAATGQAVGPEFRVNTYTTNAQVNPSISVDSTGDFIVAWTSAIQEGSSFGVFAQRYDSAGVPLGPEFHVNTYTPNSQMTPAVGSDELGNFVIVWHSDSQDGYGRGVFGQRYDSGGVPLGAEFRVNTYTNFDQHYPVVALDGAAGSNFAVAWAGSDQDGSAGGIFAQRFGPSGGPLGPEFRVNTYTTGYQFGLAAASDTGGNFVVVWGSDGQDGSIVGVFGQRYSGAGDVLGPEFRVNTFTTGPQNAPAVAADDLGNFVVVWMSDGQDGSASGIFAQRYSQIVPVELMHFAIE